MSNEKVLYICDRRKCEACSDDCMYTLDVTHAANFRYDGFGNIIEVKPVELPEAHEANGLRLCFVDGEKAYFHKWASYKMPIVKISIRNRKKAIGKLSDLCERLRENFVLSEEDAEIQLSERTLGIIEYEDGTVAEVEPTKIKFIVSEENKE